MLSGGLGRWAPAVPLAWLLVTPVSLTPAGERAAVRLGFGYRQVHAEERAVVKPVISTAAKRCRLDDGLCDIYVQPHAHTVNAYASGRRSIAVSGGLVTALGQGSLTRAQAVAMLSHEIGHLRDHSTGYGLITAWLTAPGRAAVFMFGGLLRLIVRNVPTAKAALVLVPVLLVVAGMQAAQHHAWAPLAVLTALAAVLTLHPVADAASSRASEIGRRQICRQRRQRPGPRLSIGCRPTLTKAVVWWAAHQPPPGRRPHRTSDRYDPQPGMRWSLMWAAIGSCPLAADTWSKPRSP
jgi:hypothetical protein